VKRIHDYHKTGFRQIHVQAKKILNGLAGYGIVSGLYLLA